MSDAQDTERCLTAAWLSDTGPDLACTEVVTAEGIELLIYGPDGRVCDTSFIPFELLDEDDQVRVTAAAGAAAVPSPHEVPSVPVQPVDSRGRAPAGMDRVPEPRLSGRALRA